MSIAQSQQSSFLASDEDFKKMPDLKDLFRDIDELIASYVEKHPETNETITRRFVAGHVAYEDLNQFESFFKVLGKKSAARREWDTVMGMAMTDAAQGPSKKRRIDQETIAKAHLLRQELDNDPEIRARFERKQEEQESKAQSKKKPSLSRLAQYNKDIEKFQHNMAYMRVNYGSVMILVCANEFQRRQIDYPPESFTNSGNVIKKLKSIQVYIVLTITYFLRHFYCSIKQNGDCFGLSITFPNGTSRCS